MTASSVSRRAATLMAAALTISLAACGASDSTTDAAAEPAGGTFPVTVEADNGPVTIEEMPDAIVSLSPAETEILFAIGAGDQVIAADEYSNYPEEAPDEAGLSGFTPNLEAIVAKKPDLVIVSGDMDGIVGKLATAGIPTLQLDAATSIKDAYSQFSILGTATGHQAEAEALIAETTDRIAAAVASVGGKGEGMTYFHELDPTPYSVTSETFIGSVYAEFGLVNIADEAPEAAASGGYPMLNWEYVVKAAPELIVLTDVDGETVSAEAIADRPGFDAIPAVQNGDVIEMNPDIASRWGPRIAEFAEAVAQEINED